MFKYLLCRFIVKAPTFSSQPTSKLEQLKGTAKFTCSATGYKVKYKWKIGSGIFPEKVMGINADTLVIPDVRSSDDNTYYCIISNVGGKAKSDPAKLTVTGKNIVVKYHSFITQFEI